VTLIRDREADWWVEQRGLIMSDECQVVGRQYTEKSVVVDWRDESDDHVALLLLQSDGLFVKGVICIDEGDVLVEGWSEDGVRWASIRWENGE